MEVNDITEGTAAYVPTEWADGVDGGTPIDAASLNNMEGGILAAHQMAAAAKAGIEAGQVLVFTEECDPSSMYGGVWVHEPFHLFNGLHVYTKEEGADA